MVTVEELKALNVKELEAKLGEVNKELFDLLGLLRKNRSLEKPHLLKNARKDRARIRTILHQKQYQLS